jgi:cation transport ATPase
VINEKILLEFVDSKGGFGCMTRENWLELENLQKADGEKAIARADEAGKGEKEKEVLWAATRKAKAIQTEARLKEADEREVEKEAAWQVQRESEKEARWEAQQEAETESISAAEESEREKNDSVQEPHWIYRVIRWCVIVYGSMGIFIVIALNFPIIGLFLILLFWINVLTSGGNDHSNISNGQ